MDTSAGCPANAIAQKTRISAAKLLKSETVRTPRLVAEFHCFGDECAANTLFADPG
jgi:hypothetical protein